MPVELIRVKEQDKAVLANLVQFYCYDMSPVRGVEVDAHGQFPYRYVDHYFVETDRDVRFIRHDGALAGFVMTRELPTAEREMAEFFVMRGHRRAGVGSDVAERIFSLHRTRWVVAFDNANAEAVRFWPSVVSRLSSGQVERRHIGPPEHRIDRTILQFSSKSE